jgi:hypothetical protein
MCAFLNSGISFFVGPQHPFSTPLSLWVRNGFTLKDETNKFIVLDMLIFSILDVRRVEIIS